MASFWTPWSGTRAIFYPVNGSMWAQRQFMKLWEFKNGRCQDEQGRFFVVFRCFVNQTQGADLHRTQVMVNGEREWVSNFKLFVGVYSGV